MSKNVTYTYVCVFLLESAENIQHHLQLLESNLLDALHIFANILVKLDQVHRFIEDGAAMVIRPCLTENYPVQKLLNLFLRF